MDYRKIQSGFVLPAAIFLMVIMLALAAFMVEISTTSNTSSGADAQGARAYQAARVGIEAGIYSVRISASCPASTTITAPTGLTGFTIVWTCSATAVTQNGVSGTLWQITSTACSPLPAACPSATGTTLQSNDYVERQLVVLVQSPSLAPF